MYTDQELNSLFSSLRKKEKACYIAYINLNLLTDNGQACSIYKPIFHQKGLWKVIIESSVQNTVDALSTLKPHINSELFNGLQAYFAEWETPEEGKSFSTLQAKIQEVKWLTSQYLEYLQSDFYRFQQMSLALEEYCQHDLDQFILQKDGLSNALYEQRLNQKTHDLMLAQNITAPYKNASLTRAQQFEKAKICFLKSKDSFTFSNSSILSSCLYWMSQLLVVIHQKISSSPEKVTAFSVHPWLQKNKTNLFHMDQTLTDLSHKENLHAALSKF